MKPTFEEAKKEFIDELLRQDNMIDEVQVDFIDIRLTALLEAWDESKWKPYPENEPEPEIRYLCQDENKRYWILQGQAVERHNPPIISYCELPKPYTRKEE
jgi:hypothetical protein